MGREHRLVAGGPRKVLCIKENGHGTFCEGQALMTLGTGTDLKT